MCSVLCPLEFFYLKLERNSFRPSQRAVQRVKSTLARTFTSSDLIDIVSIASSKRWCLERHWRLMFAPRL